MGMAVTGILIFIFVSIAILVVGLLLYKKVYKSNMNKALDGEGRQGMLEPSQIIYILAVIVLIILSSISISKINSLQTLIYDLNNKVNHLQWQNDIINSNIHSLENDFNNYFDGLELVQNYDYQLMDINDQDLLVYSFTFTLLEKENLSNVSIVLIDSNNTTIIIPVTSTSLVYSVDLELEIDEIYTIDVLIEGSSTVQKNITEMNISDLIEDFIWVQFEPIDYSDEPAMEVFGITVVNDQRLIDELKTSSVTFEIFIDGVLTETYNLTEKTKTVNGYDIFQVEYDISPEYMNNFTVTFTITNNSGDVTVIKSGL